jgi:hypothetical protein
MIRVSYFVAFGLMLFFISTCFFVYINDLDPLECNQCLSQDGWFQWDHVPTGEAITIILIPLFVDAIGLYP